MNHEIVYGIYSIQMTDWKADIFRKSLLQYVRPACIRAEIVAPVLLCDGI